MSFVTAGRLNGMIRYLTSVSPDLAAALADKVRLDVVPVLLAEAFGSSAVRTC